MNNIKSIGKPIKTLNRLYSLALQRKSVFVKCWNKPIPAAVILHLQGTLIHRYISENQLFEYMKKG